MKYLYYILLVVPLYMTYISSTFRTGAIYFAGIYTTSIYDCKPIIDFTKPYVEPIREEVVKILHVGRIIYEKEMDRKIKEGDKDKEQKKEFFKPFIFNLL